MIETALRASCANNRQSVKIVVA
ncbi:hypothetical protein [Candidatus Stoquefichus massiliensis]